MSVKDWPFPTHPAWLYRLKSRLVLTGVGATAKVLLSWINRLHTVNLESFRNLVEYPVARNRPLLTLCNHFTNPDDPFYQACLSWRQLLWKQHTLRWSMAAKELCFHDALHNTMFSLGRCVPVVRGAGVYQKSVDFCIEKLNNREWVHIFPEGKVNMDRTLMRLKWGVGRMLFECTENPRILPFWLVGTNDVLHPSRKPYIPKMGQAVTAYFPTETLDLSNLLDETRTEFNAGILTADDARRRITDRLQRELYGLRQPAEQAHFERFGSIPE